MTELLYLPTIDDAYERRFAAHVTALPPGAIVLDRTLFYPVGGGQPADRGVLAGALNLPVPVVDVTKSGPHVVHRLRRRAGDRSQFHAGDELTGEIDWERRYRHMRLHTAQHLLSAVLFTSSGLRTLDAIMGGVGGRVDLERALPEAFDLSGLGAEVNQRVREGRVVTLRNMAREAWIRAPSPRAGLVALPREVDPVRVVEIAGVDACPCGGTHVRSTAEIGTVAVDAPTPLPGGGVRIPFRLVGAGAPIRPE